ncbi:MAG: hypothetical protein ABI200_02955, partial [Gaiellales bacterium]
RAVVAARLAAPGTEWDVFRTLQRGQFTTSLLLDDADQLRSTLEGAQLDGVDAAAIVGRIDDEDVLEVYEQDRAAARSAAGTPGSLQGKTSDPDGVERYSAPSLVLEQNGRRLEAAGFQRIEAYDVLVANLDPTLDRRGPAEDAAEVLAYFPNGLVTQEVAAVLQQGNDDVDRAAAELQLIDLLAAGKVRREPLGDDARWWWLG